MILSRQKLMLMGVIATALTLTAGLTASAEAKKSKSTAEETKAVNLPIPDRPAAGPSTALTSEIEIGKKFKKKVVGDLNVTAFQTTGSAAGAANDLRVKLTAPNGRTVQLLLGIGDQSIGPLTMDDDTTTIICNQPPASACGTGLSAASLFQPFAGTANLQGNLAGVFDSGPLSDFNGTRMRGTWRLTVIDLGNGAANGTNTLNQWGLRIKAAKPVSE
jgi:subtilisin-like proprotein convertase family protein